MNEIPDYERKLAEWLNRPIAVLDTIGLTDAHRREGSPLMGGSSAIWIDLAEAVDRMHEVTQLVVRWGDPELSTWLARMHEHGAPVLSEHQLLDARNVPISAVIGSMVFTLTIQSDKEGLLAAKQEYPERFMDLSWDEVIAMEELDYHQSLPIPRPELLVRHGDYLMAVGIGTNIE